MPRNAWREEPWWHWWPQQELRGGTMAHELNDADEPVAPLRAMLYLPDPDSWSGWRLHRIRGEPPQAPPRRKLGWQ